jgi:hypothetical protein
VDIVGQDLLTDLLEGSPEYAEFVVGVELLESATEDSALPG